MRIKQVVVALLLLFGACTSVSADSAWSLVGSTEGANRKGVSPTIPAVGGIGCGGVAGWDPPDGFTFSPIGTLPIVPQSIMVKAGDSTPGGPLVGRPVTFQVLDASGTQPSDLLAVELVNPYTDGKGRSQLIVRPGNCSHAVIEEWATIRVRVYKDAITYKDLDFNFAIFCQSYYPFEAPAGWPPLPRDNGKIYYMIHTAAQPKYDPLMSFATSVWTSPGEVEFVNGGYVYLNPAIYVDEYFNNQEPYVWVFGTTYQYLNPREIKFNSAALDGDDPRWGPDGGWVVPLARRHNQYQTASHELGHALFLDHVYNHKALMHEDAIGYYLWGTQSPTVWDWPAVHAGY